MINKSNIRIILKIKPHNSQNTINYTVKNNNDGQQFSIKLSEDECQRLQFDSIYDANNQQQDIFQACKLKEQIYHFLEGYNVAIMAYGQTGAGKTFSLQGNQQIAGIIPKAIQEVFKKKSKKKIVKCSFLQIYNQKITDMFTCQQGLKIRWETEKQFAVDQLSERVCDNEEQMIKQWKIGCKNRIVANTKMNDNSSRSHSLFIINVDDEDQDGNNRIRSAYFVDLAGSERMYSPIGRLSKQSIEINKSLFFLRKVISTLSQMNKNNSQVYIPYRDSKLTSILKKCLGGNCLSIFISCVNLNTDHIEQTISTLQYAVSANNIVNEAVINMDQKTRKIKELQHQNESLQKDLEAAMRQIEMLRSIQREEQMKRAIKDEYGKKMVQCIGTIRDLLHSNKQLRSQLDKEKLQKKSLALQVKQIEKKNLKIKINSYAPPKVIKMQQNAPTNENVQTAKQINYVEKFDESNYKKSFSLDFHSFKKQNKTKRGSVIIRRKNYTLLDKKQKYESFANKN